MKFSRAFTMIEMVFVIVVLAILAAIAVPKLAATRTDADITKGRADIASVRSGIVSERQGRLIQGQSSWIANGTGAGQMDNGGLFGGVLMYPMANESNKNGKWSATAGSGTYVFRADNINTTFTYYPTDSGSNKAGTFTCSAGSGNCDILTN
ncbi:MAG: prepilin-type N-terminal cleavage/methylation domain-containing protein [Sulfurimonas sp.]|uniref:prepilin-type N-terminal cleavage/methylation domain-containing protein n=1 Tax=Sulfurimonas sp. TaxID=2022749 RepID=UPI0026040DB9|nr:prepilin-type N-terminal cleavage/methylation domain-containing protein [Sulfurimonas sp.]MDD5373797.1 prepilin-type N-terminal cleavage/methylation domain-containing protein [Sulfurimonas sp.]